MHPDIPQSAKLFATRPLAQRRVNGKEFMEYLIGVVLAAVVCAFAGFAGFDRERVFYPTVLIVIAT